MANQDKSYTHYLGSSWREVIRLNTQREMIRRRIGWTVSPKITKACPDLADSHGIKIADLATGTGVIALELNDMYPKADIYGLDLTTSKFPAPVTVPDKVKLETYDFFQDPPERFRNAFDIVNVSLIGLALMNGGKETAIKNMFTMLKPGGWLQWIDCPYPFWGPIDPNDLQSGVKEMDLHRISQPVVTKSTGLWTEQLDTVLEAAGFEDVDQYTVPLSKATLQIETNIGFWTVAEIMGTSLSSYPEQAQKERSEIFNKMEEGIMNGDLYAHLYFVITARKPM